MLNPTIYPFTLCPVTEQDQLFPCIMGCLQSQRAMKGINNLADSLYWEPLVYRTDIRASTVLKSQVPLLFYSLIGPQT